MRGPKEATEKLVHVTDLESRLSGVGCTTRRARGPEGWALAVPPGRGGREGEPEDLGASSQGQELQSRF